ncbi:PH domain-containing protein [Xylariomycetidae sp. FL0641]|nr:PH domain-containing protein [Xylariomycetidae sp. FL0641]
MSGDSHPMPLRQGTTFSDEAVPDIDPTTTAGLLAERLQAWKHAVGYLEEYIGAVERVHKTQSKEYEKVLKTISHPLREGAHFDQGLGGVAGFFENMRVNTQAMINTNAETEKTIKGTVLPILARLHQEIKAKHKEVSSGAEKSAKEIEKARNMTQKHIELLGQQAAAFESTGGKMNPTEDPYVIQRGVLHRLNKQVLEENNHRNDLINLQENFQAFEAHVIQVVQQAMESFTEIAGGQAEKTRALHTDMLGAVQRIPPDFEWKGFTQREGHRLVNPFEVPRSVEALSFPNQNHNSTKPLIEGSLERKSRNKLSWGMQSGYYVITPSKFLHEFKDDDNYRQDPKPELSIYLPEAVIGSPSGDKFNIKGKDKSKSISSKLSGTSELAFKAHSPAEAEKWFEAIRTAAGGGGVEGSTSPSSSVHRTDSVAHKEQEAGITGADTVDSPAAMSPAISRQGTLKESEASGAAEEDKKTSA